MSELLREIEEDIRAERLHRLWAKFGRGMVWVSVAVVLGTAAGVLWKQYNASENAKATSAIMQGMQAMAEGKYDAAITKFDTLKDKKSTAHWRIAMLHKARSQQESGDKEGAGKTYDMLIKDGSSKGDEAFTDLAKIESSALSSTPIVPKKGSPFYYTLSEWQGWQLVKDGKKDEAAKIFTALVNDENAPPSMRERAQLAANYLAPSGKNDAQ